MTPEELAGTYRLIEWVAETQGARWEPFGRETQGLITYTVDGRMIGMLSKSDRPRSTAAHLPAAPADEQAAMAAGFLAYAGTYSLDDLIVTHHVEMSLFPNWIGSDQVRKITVHEDGDVELRTPPELSRSGRTVVNRLRWRRIEST